MWHNFLNINILFINFYLDTFSLAKTPTETKPPETKGSKSEETKQSPQSPNKQSPNKRKAATPLKVKLPFKMASIEEKNGKWKMKNQCNKFYLSYFLIGFDKWKVKYIDLHLKYIRVSILLFK